MAKLTKEEIIDGIKELTVLELNELVEACEEEFGVTAAAAAVAGAGAGAAADEKDEFDVELTETGASKIKVIKAIRAETSLGLKDAKQMAESAPTMIKEGLDKEAAEELKAKFEEVGAKITLK